MTLARVADDNRSAFGDSSVAGDRAVSIWLWSVAALVIAMVVVGGATRLTESGLSITEWQPLLGAVPPLSHADWIAAFEKYKQIPQYHIMNQDMTLDAFKSIYWWEWSHRFLGRFIGIAFALPLIFFWLTGRLKRGSGAKFLGVLALGGVQGVIGWYMVKSGLVDRVDVSQYRLALHLITAFAILGLLVWLALEEWPDTAHRAAGAVTPTIRRMGVFIVLIVVTQVVLGAFVAGLKAGFIYNTWPTMDGQWIPSDYWTTPAYLTFFESHAASQFNHRMMAYFVVLAVLTELWLVMRSAVDSRIRATAVLLALAVFAQVALGIATLLAHVPLELGVAHQLGGAIVFVLSVVHLHAIRRAAVSA
ncbi:cytochrome oxidase assembly [Hyphomicrobium denitrificans 1NES1]|uniref:Heme A synthase n=1 Tax=Hyphomicrobium denitrificans 1NES1 TaxID=670307 RepID=N0B741_9HYPH|nr:COX15/CtaA family protein [Hyphomicrobium denitrificans]AGK58027.1 cytochrome oxidase assembly [Hyphomicrobium denitrificans 1NES1]